MTALRGTQGRTNPLYITQGGTIFREMHLHYLPIQMEEMIDLIWTHLNFATRLWFCDEQSSLLRKCSWLIRNGLFFWSCGCYSAITSLKLQELLLRCSHRKSSWLLMLCLLQCQFWSDPAWAISLRTCGRKLSAHFVSTHHDTFLLWTIPLDRWSPKTTHQSRKTFMQCMAPQAEKPPV